MQACRGLQACHRLQACLAHLNAFELIRALNPKKLVHMPGRMYGKKGTRLNWKITGIEWRHFLTPVIPSRDVIRLWGNWLQRSLWHLGRPGRLLVSAFRWFVPWIVDMGYVVHVMPLPLIPIKNWPQIIENSFQLRYFKGLKRIHRKICFHTDENPAGGILGSWRGHWASRFIGLEMLLVDAGVCGKCTMLCISLACANSCIFQRHKTHRKKRNDISALLTCRRACVWF